MEDQLDNLLRLLARGLNQLMEDAQGVFIAFASLDQAGPITKM